jgi:hypothetical protein
MTLKKFSPTDLVACGFLVILTWLTLSSTRYFPYNMDEFLDVQRWFCRANALNEQFHTLKEGCTNYDLKLPLTQTFLPFRTYPYIGNFSPTYYPFHYLIGSPIAHRVFGLVNYIALAWLVAFVFELRFAAVVLAFAAFPVFFFTFMLDLGLVGVLLQLFVLATLTFRKSLRQTSWSLAGIAGGLLYLGYFQRQNFVWLLIPFVIVTWAPARKNWRLYGVLAAVFGTLFVVYNFSETRYGVLVAASGRDDILGPKVLAIAVDEAQRLRPIDFPISETVRAVAHIAIVKASQVYDKFFEMMAFHFEPTRFAFRNGFFPSSPLKYVLLFLAIGTSVLILKTRMNRYLFGCYVITLATMSVFEQTWAAHHYVLALFFFVVALAKLLSEDRKLFGVVTVLAFLVWVTVVSQLDRLTPPPGHESRVGFEKDRILPYVKEDGLEDRVVQFHDSWGTYYILHSFGSKNSLVIFQTRDLITPATFEYLVDVARKTQRHLLVITDSSDESFRSEYVSHFGEPISLRQFGSWIAAEFSVF